MKNSCAFVIYSIFIFSLLWLLLLLSAPFLAVLLLLLLLPCTDFPIFYFFLAPMVHPMSLKYCEELFCYETNQRIIMFDFLYSVWATRTTTTTTTAYISSSFSHFPPLIHPIFLFSLSATYAFFFVLSRQLLIAGRLLWLQC